MESCTTIGSVDLLTYRGTIVIESTVRLTGHFIKHFTRPAAGVERHVIEVSEGKLSRLHKGDRRRFAWHIGGRLECIRNGVVEDSLVHMMFPETMGIASKINAMDTLGWSGTPILESTRFAATQITPSGIDLSEWPLRFEKLRSCFLFHTPLNSVKFILQPH